MQANSESFVMYILGKATSRWTRSRGDQTQLVPAFNGFQVSNKHNKGCVVLPAWHVCVLYFGGGVTGQSWDGALVSTGQNVAGACIQRLPGIYCNTTSTELTCDYPSVNSIIATAEQVTSRGRGAG